jgi:outer membrane lipoprotein-sorting protein
VILVVLGLAALGAALGASILLQDSTNSADSFTLTAELHVVSLSTDNDLVEDVRYLYWRYSPPSNWYHEVSSASGLIPHKITVNDGITLWQYYPEFSAFCTTTSSYKGEVIAIPDGMLPSFIGPTSASTIEDLISQLEDIHPTVDASIVAADVEFLSTTVSIVEYAPAASPESGWDSSRGRIWIDVERMFVLRHVIEETGGAQRRYEGSVVALSYQDASADAIEFDPPAGARRFAPVDNNCDQGLVTS